MRAAVITRADDVSGLEIRDRPDPTASGREIVVRVEAAAMNRADLLQRRGRYPAPAGAPADIPGLEFAGTVAERGSLARTFGIGARVMGIVGGGAQSERVLVDERTCIAIPDRLGWTDAAAVPEAFLTAFDALAIRARSAPGSHVLISAAGSGVGTAAVQIARALGSTVTALSRTAAKRERLLGLGCRAAVDPTAPDAAERIRSFGTVDTVVDLVGPSAWSLYLDVLGEGGRMVLLGLLGGARAEVNATPFLVRGIELGGSTLRGRTLGEKAALVEAFAARALPWLANGRLVPVVDRVLPLDDIERAHELMERNVNFGKIVLVPRPA